MYRALRGGGGVPGRSAGLYAAGAAFVLLAVVFIFWGADGDFEYLIPRRLSKLAAMCVGGCCVALSSIVFQTLAGNRILTPAVMGYEAVYLLLQALLVLGLGVASLERLGEGGNFALSVGVMLVYSAGLHRLLFGHGTRSVPLLLLVGLVLTMVINTLTGIVQVRISPGEFAIFQGFAQISFDELSPVRLLWSAGLLGGVCLIGQPLMRVLDVLALGRDQALSLGVDHDRSVRLAFALIAALTAVSTALVGPTAFMGIFVANTAYALAGTARHRATLPAGCIAAVLLFLVGQLAVDHLFDGRATVGLLVNVACGAYVLAVVARSRSTL